MRRPWPAWGRSANKKKIFMLSRIWYSHSKKVGTVWHITFRKIIISTSVTLILRNHIWRNHTVHIRRTGDTITREYNYSIRPVCLRKCLLILDFTYFHAVLRYEVLQLCLCALWGQTRWRNATLNPWKSFLLPVCDDSKLWTDFPAICCSGVLPTLFDTVLCRWNRTNEIPYYVKLQFLQLSWR